MALRATTLAEVHEEKSDRLRGFITGGVIVISTDIHMTPAGRGVPKWDYNVPIGQKTGIFSEKIQI